MSIRIELLFEFACWISPDRFSTGQHSRFLRTFAGAVGEENEGQLRQLLWQTQRELPTAFYSRFSVEIPGFLGKWRVNVLPFPSSDSTVTSPPCSNARC